MNERIRELILHSTKEGDAKLDFIDTEKFAELIAQDAISVVQSFRWKMDASNDNIVVALKQHFGVE